MDLLATCWMPLVVHSLFVTLIGKPRNRDVMFCFQTLVLDLVYLGILPSFISCDACTSSNSQHDQSKKLKRLPDFEQLGRASKCL